ncbi:MAG: LSU ribosomal protein L23p (L23Ae), partial [uncultured Corynebacteriales bacterium]
DRRPAGRAARPGHLGEELRAAGRQQVHVRRPPGRQQDADQDRGRAGLQREGPRRQHAEPAGQAQAHPVGVRSPQGHQARHRELGAGRPDRDLRRTGEL